jgi:hypothetical protein
MGQVIADKSLSLFIGKYAGSCAFGVKMLDWEGYFGI